MSRSHTILIASLTVIGTACSAIVSVDLPVEGSDDDCNFLNSEPRGEVTECVRWQFNGATKECELVPLDRDDDGFFPAVCIDDPVADITAADVDCNDDPTTGATAFPRNTEACEGTDNDCDGRVDEGAMTPSLSVGPTVGFSALPSDVSYATDPLAVNSVGVAYTLGITNTPPGVSVRSRDFGSENAEQLRVFTADAANAVAVVPMGTVVSNGTDIASLGNNQYAVAVINNSGGRRLIAGVATQANLKTLFTETSVFESGLPCASSDGDCSMTRPQMDAPVISASGNQILVAAIRRTTAASCNDDGTATEARVVGSALQKRDFMNVALGMGGARVAYPTLRPTTENPTSFDVGMIRVDGSAAAIGMPGGFLVALPQTDNTMLLRTVRVTAGVYAVSTDDDVTLQMGSDELPLLDPAFALSTPIDHDGDDETAEQAVLALAFRRGCAGDGTVHVKLYNVDPETGVISPRAGAPRTVDGEGVMVSESRPSISFASDQGNTWVVAFSKQSNLRARVLDVDGTPQGTTATTLIGNASRVGSAPAVFPVPVGSFGGARYGAMVDATIDGETGVYTVHLGCFEEGD